jgi:hypothetical protein
MKPIICALLLALALASPAVAAEKNVDHQAQEIIKKKCTSCHGEAKIKAAFAAGKDMRAIQKEMQRRGAKLSGNEQDVLGIYWKQSPVLK